MCIHRCIYLLVYIDGYNKMYLKEMLKVLVFYHLTMSNFVIEPLDKVYSVPQVLNICWLRLVHLVLKRNSTTPQIKGPSTPTILHGTSDLSFRT